MPLMNDTLPARKEFTILDEGQYQVLIKDINEVEGKNLNTGAPEARYEFDLQVLDGSNKGHIMKIWASQKYSAAKEGRSESKLYSIVTRVFGKPIPADELHLSELMGKQMIIVVSKYKTDTGYDRNKVVMYMDAKKKLPVIEEPTDEIKLEDIPF